MLRYIKTFFLFIITVAFIVFAVANRQTVHLSFFPFPYSADIPAFLLAVFWFALGAMIGGVAVQIKLSKKSYQYNHEHKRVVALENEVSGLRNEHSIQQH